MASHPGPQVRDTPARFERACCIGVPAIVGVGVGVVKLSAATRITVTGP
jgi:hypothetical protein